MLQSSQLSTAVARRLKRALPFCKKGKQHRVSEMSRVQSWECGGDIVHVIIITVIVLTYVVKVFTCSLFQRTPLYIRREACQTLCGQTALWKEKAGKLTSPSNNIQENREFERVSHLWNVLNCSLITFSFFTRIKRQQNRVLGLKTYKNILSTLNTLSLYAE